MIKVALVGCGRIAQKHAKLLGEGQIDGMKLAAVCDVKREPLLALTKKYQVSGFSDMHEMMEKANSDLVSILTPSGMHADHVVELADYGVDILCEKPLALTPRGADRAIAACECNGIRLGVVKQNRYNVAVQKLVNELPRFGDLNFGSIRVLWSRDANYYADWHGTWRYAGGVLANQAIHHVDLLQWIMGPVNRVGAFAKYSDYTEVETGLVASLEFESGALGTIEVTTLTAKNLEGSLLVLGERGTAHIGGFAVNRIDNWTLGGIENKLSGVGENPPDVYGFGHKKLYEGIMNCIKHDIDFPVDGYEAKKSIDMVNAIYESIEIGTIVIPNGTYPQVRLGKDDIGH